MAENMVFDSLDFVFWLFMYKEAFLNICFLFQGVTSLPSLEYREALWHEIEDVTQVHSE